MIGHVRSLIIHCFPASPSVSRSRPLSYLGSASPWIDRPTTVRAPDRTPPELERLEERAVPAYTAAITGPGATFTGDGASDTLIIDTDGGLLRHNRADPGFNG